MGCLIRFEENESIVVIGATNFPESLDPAVVRPGRFDKVVTIPVPSYDVRKKILNYYLKNLKMDKVALDIDKIADITINMTGADLKNLVNTAGIYAVSLKEKKLTQDHLTYSFERMTMGLKRNKNISSAEELKRTAYHEAGHALTSLLTPGSNKLHKITILPVGQALGLSN